MDREARLALEDAVADLREISHKLEAIAPQTDDALRAELLAMRAESEKAVQYYRSVLARNPRPKAPAVAERVAQAAFGCGGVGLILPQFASGPRQ